MSKSATSTEIHVQCEVCEGSGRVALGEHFISREMASDGGTPELEGASMGIEYCACPNCGGSGLLKL